MNSAPVRRKDSQSTPGHRAQQDAEGPEQGQIPRLSGQQADRGENQEVASPVGEHIQVVQAEVQMDEEIAQAMRLRALRMPA